MPGCRFSGALLCCCLPSVTLCPFCAWYAMILYLLEAALRRHFSGRLACWVHLRLNSVRFWRIWALLHSRTIWFRHVAVLYSYMVLFRNRYAYWLRCRLSRFTDDFHLSEVSDALWSNVFSTPCRSVDGKRTGDCSVLLVLCVLYQGNTLYYWWFRCWCLCGFQSITQIRSSVWRNHKEILMYAI